MYRARFLARRKRPSGRSRWPRGACIEIMLRCHCEVRGATCERSERSLFGLIDLIWFRGFGLPHPILHIPRYLLYTSCLFPQCMIHIHVHSVPFRRPSRHTVICRVSSDPSIDSQIFEQESTSETVQKRYSGTGIKRGLSIG